MKFAASAAVALAVLPHTLAAPVDSDTALSQRQPDVIPEIWERAIDTRDFEIRDAEADADDLSTHNLEKRRGGGGGGRGGGGSSSSGSSSSGGRGGSSSGSSSGSSGGSSSSSSGRGGSSSGSSGSGSSSGSSGGRGGSTGGSTSSSSSSSPSYGGGRYYGGGSTSAYSAGARSPIGGITPFLIGGSLLGLGAAALLWPHNVYNYPWHTRYNYRNGTNRTTTNTRRQDNGNGTVSLPVICLCDPDQSCGCDDNGNSTYFDQFLGPGNTTNNATLVTIQNVNSTDTVVLNGTLPNGTDGSDDGSDDSDSAARMLHVQAGGYTIMSAAMVASLWLL